MIPATVANDPSLPSIEIAGRCFHAETHGQATNPTIVVLHGGPGGDYRSLLALRALWGPNIASWLVTQRFGTR